jgi:hypothetical protein
MQCWPSHVGSVFSLKMRTIGDFLHHGCVQAEGAVVAKAGSDANKAVIDDLCWETPASTKPTVSVRLETLGDYDATQELEVGDMQPAIVFHGVHGPLFGLFCADVIVTVLC